MDFGANALYASVFLSAVGVGFFVYGKKQRRAPQLVGGLLLMVFPYFVTGAGWMLLTGGAVVLGIVLAVRYGL
ncbi:MAG: hypothetical protein V2A76_07445 [Planctomycetota bacterium]